MALEYALYRNALVAAIPGFVVRELRVTGGGEKSRVWNQLKADRLQAVSYTHLDVYKRQDLMGPEMRHIGLHAGWVLVYTAAIMTFLRLNAGFFSHRFSPFAILAGGATLAALGLMSLSYAVGIGVLLAATIYGLGKAYFWSTTIGVVGDQFPKGGALTMNSIGGVGMLGLSVGMVFLGNVQDRRIDRELLAHDAASGTTLHTDYLTIAKHSIFGNYLALDQDALNKAPVRDLQQIEAITVVAKKGALRTAAMFPTAMLCAYIALLFYYKARGGYRVHVLAPSVASSA